VPRDLAADHSLLRRSVRSLSTDGVPVDTDKSPMSVRGCEQDQSDRV